MALDNYLIDTSGQPTPDQVKRRQAYADALMKQGADYSPVASPWQGAARLAQGLLGGYERGQADQAEQSGRAAYQQRLAAALQGGGTVSPQSMIALSGDPWANPAQTQTISHIADMQRQQARDAISDKHWAASYDLQKQAADRAAQAAERANMTEEEKAAEREKAAIHYGLQPGSNEYRAYVLSGKLPESTASVPNSVSEYNYYKSTFQPTAENPQPMDYATFSTAKSRAGATNVTTNVDTKGPDKYDTVMGEGLAKSHAALSNGVEDAQARARDLAAMQGAIDAIQKNGGTTGGMGQAQALELGKTINAGAAALGLEPPINEKGISDKEFLTKFNRQIAGAQAKGAMGSRVTNFEMSNYLKANPGLEMSITGNQRLIGIQSQIEQRNVAVGNAIRMATADAIGKGQKVNPAAIQKIITDYDQQHHIQDPVTGQDLTQSYTLPEFQKGGNNPALATDHATNIKKIGGYTVKQVSP